MTPVIAPVDRALLEAELTEERRLRHTNKGDNEIYIIEARTAPQDRKSVV